MKRIEPVDAAYHSAHSPKPIKVAARDWVITVYGKRARACYVDDDLIGVVFPRRNRWHAIYARVDEDFATQGDAIEALIAGQKEITT